jgi:SPP1 family phage portal protein
MNEQTMKELHDQNARRQAVYRQNRSYFYGRNPWIESREQRREPDNRIAIPFAKMAVEDMAGYAAMPGYRTVEIDNIRTDASVQQDAGIDTYIQLVREIESANDSDRLTAELYQEALVHGRAFELFWYDDAVEFARVPENEIELVYDGSLKPELVGAVRFYDRARLFARRASVYTDVDITDYTRDGSGSWTESGIRLHPYGRVPINIYAINTQQQPFFEAEKGLIDAQDKLLSSSVNEVDRFNAVMALFPQKVDKEFIDKLREMNVIDDLGDFDRWPEYLEKDLGKITSFYQQLADRLERLFHKSIKVPDFSDENFVGNSSGVALAYKLLGLEFKAAQIDLYFDKGINGRYELISSGINAGARQYPTDDYEIIIDNKRNLPVDEAGRVQIAQQLLGILSEETILKMLPNTIVPDVERELERISQQVDMTLEIPGEAEDDDA